ncbi:hypothetical protein MASR2M8_24160 [Opitutaceae bacterium]
MLMLMDLCISTQVGQWAALRSITMMVMVLVVLFRGKEWSSTENLPPAGKAGVGDFEANIGILPKRAQIILIHLS